MENLQRNAHHYSFLGNLGARAVAHVQNTAAQVYFHPFVTLDVPKTEAEGAAERGGGGGGTTTETSLVKYGVMSVDALKRDLDGWTSLYAAGRMQKVRVLHCKRDGVCPGLRTGGHTWHAPRQQCF
jgi:hypothetical protein